MRIYAYGARPPTEGAHIVDQQLRLAHTYHRVLVFFERDRRVAIERLYREAAPVVYEEYAAAEVAVARSAEAIRLARSTSGDILLDDEDMKKERHEILDAAKTALEKAHEWVKVVRQSWYDARKKATPNLKERFKKIDEETYAKKKFAYNAAGSVGLAWGTRLKIDQFVELAAKASIKEGFWLVGDLTDTREARRNLQGSLPRVPRWDGGGTIAVQLQGGLAPNVALAGTDTQFRLQKMNLSPWERVGGKSKPKKDGRVVDLPKSKADGHRAGRGIFAAWLRVGSEGRTPIWASWLVSIHRSLPASAPIKWVEMHARKIGPRTEWQLLITVDDGCNLEKHEDKKAGVTEWRPAIARSGGPILAVNLGWRNLPETNGEIRVAYAVGSDGHEEEIRVPPAYVSTVSHVASLESIRKKNFNEAVKALDDWLDEMEWPEVLVEAAKWRDRWLAPKKLARFISEWRKHRFEEDAKIFTIAEAWLKQDRHLWFWASDERGKNERMRKDFYRTVAARWTEKYACILVTDMDLRDFAELPTPEDGASSKGKVQRVTQRLAAPSELRESIKNACSTRGATMIEKSGTYTPVCNTCGALTKFDARAIIEHTCLECGTTWDQDTNHCQNLLASDKVMRNQAEALAPTEKMVGGEGAEKKSGRWQKRRSKKVA